MESNHIVPQSLPMLSTSAAHEPHRVSIRNESRKSFIYVAIPFSSSKIIGKFEVNSHGLFDMMGNVYEWTLSEYGPSGKNKVVRGGAWNSASHFLRTSDRVGKDPELRYSDVGFRCIKNKQ